MQPEILHRCSSCGAAIRDFDDRVLFCPECGTALTPSQKKQSDAGRQSTQKRISDQSGEAGTAKANVAETPKSQADEAAEKALAPPDGTRQGARERTRERLQRASNVARGAIEDNVKRVEKIHHVSTVVFEEAHYDPSLRFVLVAA